MAISYIGSATSNGQNVTVPAHAIGDLILIFALRGNSTTAATLPAGYTNITTVGANTVALRVGYKIATATNDTSGTWTNTSVLQCQIYRGVGSIGASANSTNAASTTTTVPALTLSRPDGNSWVVAYVGSRQTTSQTAPTGTTQRGASIANTTTPTMAIAADTNGGVSSWSATTSTAGTSAAGASGVVELLPPIPSMSTFTDAFNANSLTTSNWTQFTGGSATMTYTSAGASVVYPASTTSSTDGDISSVYTYDLTGSYAYLHVISGTTGNTDNTFRVGSGTNRLQIQQESGTLYFQKIVSGTQTNITSVTYSSSTHAYWRIREASGTTYWETSPDGITYTTQTSQANPITVTALSVLIAGTAFGSASSPGTFQFNNFNTIPGGTATPTNNFFYMF